MYTGDEAQKARVRAASAELKKILQTLADELGTTPEEINKLLLRRAMRRRGERLQYLSQPPYFGQICAAQKGSVSSGADNFSDKTEWADFHTMAEAKACEARMEALMKEFIPLAEAMRTEREESLT